MIEVLISISVISIGVLASYAVIEGFIPSIRQSSLRFTAAYLAQEGIEIVRNVRDENFLKDRNWETGLPSGDWQADYTATKLDNHYNGDYLNIDNNGFYSYQAGSKTTPFKRKITINYDGSDKLNVSVEIYWRYGKDIKGPITVQEVLYKWYR